MGAIEEKFAWDGQVPKPSNMKFTHTDANALSNFIGGSFTVVSKTTNYTAADNELVLVDATLGNLDITLPAAATGAQVTVKKRDITAHTVTIVTTGAARIDTEVNLVITTPGTSYSLISDGTDWFII